MAAFDNPKMFMEFANVLPVGLYIVDLKRTILYWNAHAEHITGYLGQDLIGRRRRDDLLMQGETSGPAATACCSLASALRNGKPAQARLFLQHKEGHRIPVRIESIPLRNDDGIIFAVAEIFAEENAGADELCWIDTPAGHLDPPGIPSAATTRDQLLLRLTQLPLRLAVFLVEVEHLDESAKTYGSGMRIATLRALVQTLVRILSVPHFIGSWADNRFLLLIPDCTDTVYEHSLEELNRVGSGCAVTWWGDRIATQVSVRATLVQEQEAVDALMIRLEQKSQPGNTVAGEL